MYTTFKKMITAAAMMSVAMAPVAAFAEMGETPELNLRAGASAKVGESGQGSSNASVRAGLDARAAATFCDFIKDKSVDDFRHMGDRMKNLDDRRDRRDDIIADIRAKFDTKHDDNQADRQEKFDTLIAKWEANAKTDVEKSAIAEFKVQLQAAINDRQGSVDAAITDARSGKDSVRADVRAKIDAAIADLEAKMNAALDKAQADCAKGTSSATVRTNFAADSKAAVDAFKSTTASIRADAKTEVGDIHDARKEDVQAARADFRGFFETLRERFQSLFGVKAKVSTEAQANTQ